jgi:NAD(P)-dependent dehydrogenase (short-subunit alcohol dehydrogenase family)
MANSKRVAIVTGAARPWGLGRCTAMGLAAKGFDLAVADMRDDWGEEAAAAIRSETETKAAYVKTDLRQRSDIEAMVARVIREFGRIDVLANVAAICPSERIEDLKEETYERVFRTNFLGTAFCCQAVLKQCDRKRADTSLISPPAARSHLMRVWRCTAPRRPPSSNSARSWRSKKRKAASW